jgi:hypothetical protein
MSAMKTTLLDTIRVLESCEAKLEYLGREFGRPNFTDRYGDSLDCRNRAAKARNAIATLRAAINEHYPPHAAHDTPKEG